jgi:hypothetical protein
MVMIRILVKNAQQAMDLKDQVLAHGLTLHEDFSWEYRPDPYDGYDDSLHAHPEARFIFVNTAQETFFQLKWAQ